MAIQGVKGIQGVRGIRGLGSSRSSIDNALTPAQQESIATSLMRTGGQFIETLGLILDTPGAIGRGILAGKPLSGFNFNYEDRTSGEELLKSYGFNVRNPYLRTAAGFATEVFTDPLFLLGMGTKAVTKAGAAASKAGLLKDAPLAYANKFGNQAAMATPKGRFLSGLMQANDVVASEATVSTLKPAGQRLAQSKLTLSDLIEHAYGSGKLKQEAKQKVVDALGGIKEFDKVKHQKLGGIIGFNVGPFNAATNVPGGDLALQALDELGARARYSWAGRVANSAFNQRVKGAVDFGEQVANLRLTEYEDIARLAGREKAIAHNQLLQKITLSPQSKKLLGADSLFTPQGNDMLTRLAENHGNATDLQILADTPQLSQWVDSWDMIQKQLFREREQLGLQGTYYKDKYGTRYSPRYGDEFDFGDAERGTGRMLFGSNVEGQSGRKSVLITPGGTDTLRKLSLLPSVRELAKPRSTVTEAQVALDIKKWFTINHPLEPIGDKQAKGIAHILRRRSTQLPDDVPVFQAHPANAQARKIIDNEIANARSEALLESIAEAAVPEAASQLQPGVWRNLQETYDQTAGSVGFDLKSTRGADRLRQKIAAATGRNPADVDLMKYSLPERVARRLQRVGETITSTTSQQELSGFLDGWTTLFKGFVLARPARFTRDAYSNAVSIYLETGNAKATLFGMDTARKILAGKYKDNAMLGLTDVPSQLRKIPKYGNDQLLDTDQKILDAFLSDAGRLGVLSGLQSSELLSGARRGTMSQLIPGSTPVQISRFIPELTPDASTFTAAGAKRFFQVYGVGGRTQDTLNPILRASQEVGDAVDSIGRLGGFIALLQQGFSAEEAAARIASALVDYSSLTLTERKFLRRIFPWYSYNSRIGKYVAQSLYDRPGGLYGQMLRFSNTAQQRSTEGEAYIPENMRSQFAVRMPEEFTRALGLYDENNTTYLKDIDLPGIDVLNLLSPDDLQETFANIVRQSAPPIQAIGSLATNRDLFYDRPLNETTTAYDRVYRYLTGSSENLSAIPKVAAQLVPGTQIPASIFGALVDERIPSMRKRLTKAIANQTLGVKFADSNEQTELYERQRKAEEALKGKTYQYSRSYVPEEIIPTLTPYEKDVYAYSKILDKEQKRLQEKRKQQKLRSQQR